MVLYSYMKASLNFDLSDPQEKIEFKIHAKAIDLFYAIKSYEVRLKEYDKYDDAVLENEVLSTFLGKIRKDFNESMDGLLNDY